jgi:membrane protein
VPKPSRLQQIQADVAATFRDGVHAHPDPESLSAFQKFTHFWALVVRFFWKNRCQIRASALAYTTLMALVPLLAVSISMLAIFQIDNAKNAIDHWISQLVQNVAPTLGSASQQGSAASREALVTNIVSSVSNAAPSFRLSGQQGADVSQEAVVTEIVKIVSNIPFGTIGITAMIGLIFAAISMMRTIEAAFNDIWGVTRSRSWWNSILLYWGVLTLGPAVLALVTTSSYVKATFQQVEWMQRLPLLGMLNTALLPIITLAIAFGLFYLLMPNTRVDPRSAAVGAAVAATLWWGNSQLGALYNTRVVTYSKIYGSLGAVPLFLLGLYFSWLILLFGSQVAYVFQNRGAYLQDHKADSIHQNGREFAALRLMTAIGMCFQRGERPPAASSLANQLGIPPKLATSLLGSLASSGLLHETSGAEAAFVPAKPLNELSIQSILLAIRTAHGRDISTAEDAGRQPVTQALDAVRKAENSSASAFTLVQLVDEALEAASASKPKLKDPSAIPS